MSSESEQDGNVPDPQSESEEKPTVSLAGDIENPASWKDLVYTLNNISKVKC